jgi:spore germination cell wall hydrolase CwlJ-like protein
VRSPKHWNVAEEIALATTAGKIWLEEVGSSTHYHATYVRPPWAKRMRKVGKIGLHIFYVTYGGGWS